MSVFSSHSLTHSLPLSLGQCHRRVKMPLSSPDLFPFSSKGTGGLDLAWPGLAWPCLPVSHGSRLVFFTVAHTPEPLPIPPLREEKRDNTISLIHAIV